VSFRRGIRAAALAAVAVATPARARADGAFPAGEAVIVPADRPQELILVTNFGLVISEDGGLTWSWSCEQEANALGTFYQLGPAPRRRLYTVANHQVVYSDDVGCSWQVAGGLLAGEAVTDVFPDPTSADRVVAIGIANGLASVFESADGGATFGSTLYEAQGGDAVNGVEIARADPGIVYLALMSTDQSPKLVRTADGGAHWVVSDLSADLGPGSLRIIAVDPADANTVLLRWSSAVDGSEAIAVTRDGGATATKPLAIPNYFTSFARMPDGTLILSAMAAVSPANVPTLYLSRDGGASFEENAAVPGVLALAERDGILYAATDNVADGYALGASSDQGVTWQPMVRFDQIASISACLRTNTQCQASCEALAGKGLGSPGTIWDEAVCTGIPAGSGSGGSAGAAGGSGGGGAAGATGGGHGASGGGGGCAVAPGRPGAGLGIAALLAALLPFSQRRRRSA
jgi:hypothetical protein